MQLYLSKAKDLAARFRSFSIIQVPRSQNKQADALSKMASVSFASIPEVVPWAMAKHALRPSVGRDKSNADGILLADDTHGRPYGNRSVSGMSST
ncbi:reverse transcriptase domain-containing protein [Tanacetum coccineum]